MTTNETSFFRDFNPFETLKKAVIPDLMEKRAQTRELTIWCAACSAGQGPYTIGMLLREYFPSLASWKVRILATDLSSEILSRAREGRYSQLEVNRGLPANFLVKYFHKEGLQLATARGYAPHGGFPNHRPCLSLVASARYGFGFDA